MKVILEAINAIRASKNFAAFFDGVEGFLPNGQKAFLKIESSKRRDQQDCYKWNRHSVVTHIVEKHSGTSSFGYGEDDIELLAIQKSISEAVERIVFFIHSKSDPSLISTNGWAAHLTEDKAKSSAQGELLERDAMLVHWLSETPLTQVNLTSMPSVFRNWTSKRLGSAVRYNQAKFFISNLGETQVASVMICDQNRFGFISHAANKDPAIAFSRAAGEVCRITDLATQRKMTRSSNIEIRTPEDHALWYSTEQSFPNWIFEGSQISYREVLRSWKTSCTSAQFDFDSYNIGHLSIVHCKSKDVQNLYFGRTQSAVDSGSINIERILKLTGSERLSALPHFVP